MIKIWSKPNCIFCDKAVNLCKLKNLEYEKLMNSFESFIIDDFYKMKFQNIFHYKNFDLKKLYNIWKREIS